VVLIHHWRLFKGIRKVRKGFRKVQESLRKAMRDKKMHEGLGKFMGM